MAGTQQTWTGRHGLGSGPVDVSHILSAEAHEAERRDIFCRFWLNVGRVEEVPNPGDYVVKPIEIAHTEVLIVRGNDNGLRAFHNLCAHRANRVTRRFRGQAVRFVCPFHHWTYDLDGRLLKVTDEDQFFDLDRSKLGLKPVALETWQGFLFVNLQTEPDQNLLSFLGEVAPRLDAYPFDALAHTAGYDVEVEANWKLSLDAFQEGYHVPFLHRRSAGRGYVDSERPFIHGLEFALYDYHRVASFPGGTAMQPTLLEQVAFQYGASVTSIEDAEAHAVPQGLNPTGAADWAFDLFVFFPNFMLFAFNGFCFTYNFWPKGLTRTLFEFNIYMPPPQNAGQRFAQELAVCGLRDTLMEDGPTLEAIQGNLLSGVKRDYILQDQEVLVRHSHHVFERLRAASGTAA